MLLAARAIAGDHRPHVRPETGKPHHDKVNEDKEYKKSCHQKMKCTGRLMTAEERHQCGENRYEGGRHGKARPNNKRKEDENHSQIRNLLQDIIGWRFFIAAPFEAYLFQQHHKNSPVEVCLRGKKVLTEVSGCETEEYVCDTVYDQYPGGQKVEIPTPTILVFQDEWNRQIN